MPIDVHVARQEYSLAKMQPQKLGPNAQGKRHRSTEGAEGTNKGQDNGEALALVGVRLTAQLGWWQVPRRPRTSEPFVRWR